jgi:hypothetical protein
MLARENFDWRTLPQAAQKGLVQQGRSESRAEAYPLGYVEGLNDARTQPADFFSSLLERTVACFDPM